jgi:hypothetical protein
MTNKQVNTLAAGWTGRDHRIVSRKFIAMLLLGTEFEDNRSFKFGVPSESFPGDYIYTVSSMAHLDNHVKCGHCYQLNAFFIDHDNKTLLSVMNIPSKIKAPTYTLINNEDEMVGVCAETYRQAAEAYNEGHNCAVIVKDLLGDTHMILLAYQNL